MFSTVLVQAVQDHISRIRSAARELELEAGYFERQLTEQGAPIAAEDAPHDTIPAAPITERLPPSEPAPFIPAGQAKLMVLAALANVAGALGRLEALSVGISRALDAAETPSDA